MKYFYYSHMGGVYTTSHEQDYDELYCEVCGDSDELIGEVETFEDLLGVICLMKNYYFFDTEDILEVIAVEYPGLNIILPGHEDLTQRDWENTDEENYPIYCRKFNVGCENWYTMADLEPDCSTCGINFEYMLYKLNTDNYRKDMVLED